MPYLLFAPILLSSASEVLTSVFVDCCAACTLPEVFDWLIGSEVVTAGCVDCLVLILPPVCPGYASGQT